MTSPQLSKRFINVDDIFLFFQFQLTNTSSIYRISISFTPFEQSRNQKGISHSCVALIICFVATYFHGEGGGLLYKVLYSEAPTRYQTPYPFHVPVIEKGAAPLT